MNAQASNFDEWYAKLHAPAAVTPHGLIPKLAETMVRLSFDTHVRQIVKEIAEGNDVASLKVYLESFIKEDLNQETKEERFDPGLTYAVTHLLVDGSGNEAFAKQWLDTMGHTPARAEEWFRDRMSLVTSKDELVYAQQRLGLATLVEDMFAKRPPVGPDLARQSPFEEAFVGMLPAKTHLSKEVLLELRMEAAALFRHFHPDGLPTATVFTHYTNEPDEVPLLNTIWRREDLQHVLGAVHLAYGANHQVAREQMVASIERVFDEGFTRLWDPAHPDDSDRWDAVVEWMGDDVLKMVVNGNFLTGFGYQQERITFFDSLMGIPMETAVERLADLQAKGFHLDDFNTEQDDERKPPVRRNLLISAIGNANQEMVSWLLSQGCDPEITSGLPDALSPYELAMELEAQFKQSHAKGEATYGAIADLMRTAKSKNEALRAIEELEAPGQGLRP